MYSSVVSEMWQSLGSLPVRGSYSARVPRSSLPKVHRVFCPPHQTEPGEGKRRQEGRLNRSPCSMTDSACTTTVHFGRQNCFCCQAAFAAESDKFLLLLTAGTPTLAAFDPPKCQEQIKKLIRPPWTSHKVHNQLLVSQKKTI